MEKKNKNNIIIVLIAILIIIISYIVGWIFGSYMANKEIEQEETKEVEEKKSENLTEDDEYILTFLESTYTDEERLKFLDYTNSGDYIAKLFTNDLTNSEKLIIGLSFFLLYHNADNGDDNLIFEKYAYSENPMTLSKSTIEKIITRYFASYEYETITNSSDSYSLYLSGTGIKSCDNDKCTIKLEIWGSEGMINEYLTQVTSSNDTEITLSTLYLSYNEEKSSNDTIYYNIYSDHKSNTLLKEGIKEPDSSDNWTNYFFSQVEGKTQNYKFTFNEQNQLEKVEEL